MKRSCFALLATLGLAACHRESPIQTQAATVRAEETPEKLLARGRAFIAVGDYERAEQYLASALDRGAEPRLALPLLLRASPMDA